jgi:TetR/AcrR family transcriptional regulator
MKTSAAVAARPGSVTARNAREELLNAASTLMNERDSLEISLNEISGLARVNSALVKYHFGNKRGLLIALIERDVGNSMSHLKAVVDSDSSPVEKLRIHVAGLINLYFRFRYLNNLVLTLLRDSTPEQAQDMSDRLIRPAADAQREILEQGWASGDFRRVDPMLFYFTLMGACDVFFSSHFTLRTVFDRHRIDDDLRRQFIDHTATLLIRGISAK